MNYNDALSALDYSSPLRNTEEYDALRKELEHRAPDTLSSIVGGIGGTILGAIPGYALGRLAGKANKWVPNALEKQHDKAAKRYAARYGESDFRSFAEEMAFNKKEAKRFEEYANNPEGGAVEAFIDSLVARNNAGFADAMSSKENMRRGFQDMMGLVGGSLGAAGGAYAGNTLLGQTFGKDTPGTAEALSALAALQSGELTKEEFEEVRRQLASHMQQTEANRGSGALEVLTNMGVGIPLAIATKHRAVAEKIKQLIPDEALSASSIVGTKMGRNFLSDLAPDVAVATPVSTAAGVGVYNLTENNDAYQNPFG